MKPLPDLPRGSDSAGLTDSSGESAELVCCRCGACIADIWTTDIEGPSHPACYAKAHPFQPATRLRDVLCNSDDLVLARLLVDQYCDSEARQTIVREFNRIMQERWNHKITFPRSHDHAYVQRSFSCGDACAICGKKAEKHPAGWLVSDL
jgi:hypothetical protein